MRKHIKQKEPKSYIHIFMHVQEYTHTQEDFENQK